MHTSSTPFPSRLSFGNLSINQSAVQDASPIPSDFHHPALISPPLRPGSNGQGIVNTPQPSKSDLATALFSAENVRNHTSANGELLVDITGLRKIVVDAIARNMLVSAIFFADKLVTLTNDASIDIYLLAQALYVNGQAKRAYHILQTHGKLVPALECKSKNQVVLNFLGAQCLSQARAWEEALALIGEGEDDAIERITGSDAVFAGRGFPSARSMRTSSLPSLGQEAANAASNHASSKNSQASNQDDDAELSCLDQLPFYSGNFSLAAGVACLRGRCYDALENRTKCLLWLKQAVRYDVACYDAIQLLFDKQMMKRSEERAFLAELVFPPELQWLKLFYLTQMNPPVLDLEADTADVRAQAQDQAHDAGTGTTPASSLLPIPRPMRRPSVQHTFAFLSCFQGGRSLIKSVSLQTSLAKWYFARNDFKECITIVKPHLETDPLVEQLIPVYVASLVQLNQPQELFKCAQKLVESNPNNALPWFAVGCYYFLVNKFDAARKFWGKCVSLDPLFAPVWLFWGHAHAAQDQTDQALVCYRAAERLLPGNPIPVLSIGSEQLRTRADVVALSTLRRALALDENEPLTHHELGVALYRRKEYAEAANCFERALKLIPHEALAHWEPTLFNLGHAWRKLGRYSDAVEAYQAALAIRPNSASTHAALAFTYHLQSRIDDAITLYHRALMIEPQDVFVNTMLARALEESTSATSLDDLYSL